jgi:hypothetical protein
MATVRTAVRQKVGTTLAGIVLLTVLSAISCDEAGPSDEEGICNDICSCVAGVLGASAEDDCQSQCRNIETNQECADQLAAAAASACTQFCTFDRGCHSGSPDCHCRIPPYGGCFCDGYYCKPSGSGCACYLGTASDPAFDSTCEPTVEAPNCCVNLVSAGEYLCHCDDSECSANEEPVPTCTSQNGELPVPLPNPVVSCD